MNTDLDRKEQQESFETPRPFYGERHDRHMTTFDLSDQAQNFSTKNAKDGLATSVTNLNQNDLAAYQKFSEEKLGFRFKNVNLIVTALTHRSYVNEHKKSPVEHNERLEYLGDAVLELVSSDFLYHNFYMPEGVMTAVRAALVRTESIGDAGVALGYEPLVRLSHGEKHSTGRSRYAILADCFEAVIGAIYLDQGFEAASDFIHKHILVKINEVIESESWRDTKSLLQELSQHIYGVLPSYHTVEVSGPDHDRTFGVVVILGNKQYGKGYGHSKQDAQIDAARLAIQRLKRENLYFPAKFSPILQK
ncbi:MAG: ribonuclease III [Candidatus Saccharibacteria bacterium]|nr:ribonuclease III [Candidatus Saccharibacteria bacterium]